MQKDNKCPLSTISMRTKRVFFCVCSLMLFRLEFLVHLIFNFLEIEVIELFYKSNYLNDHYLIL